MTQAAGEENSDPVVGEQMISRDRYHQTPAPTATAGQPHHHDQPADPQPGDQGPGDPQRPDGEAVAAWRPMPTHDEGLTTTADTKPAADEQRPHSPEEDQGLEVYADSAYGTGEARAAYRRGGHHTMIKPKPLRPAVEGGFTLDDFTIDEQTGTLTCPAGHTRSMSAKRTVTFGKLCADCPLRSRCTTATDGRSMTIHPHEQLLRAARAQARTPEFKQAYPTRSTIERIIAWTATQNGRRVKLRYLGTSKNHAWLRTRCAALNLRTLIKHGLTHRNGTWALA
jgi:hypothetical protein